MLRAAKIEVRDRLPIPDESAKVDVQIEQVTPLGKNTNKQNVKLPSGVVIAGWLKSQLESKPPYQLITPLRLLWIVN